MIALRPDVREGYAEQLALYDGLLMWGDCLDERQAQDLRVLARVYDLDAGNEPSLPRLWARLRERLDPMPA